MGATCSRRGHGPPAVAVVAAGAASQAADKAADEVARQTSSDSRPSKSEQSQPLLGPTDGGTSGASAAFGCQKARDAGTGGAPGSVAVAVCKSCAGSAIAEFTEEARALERRREECTERASASIRELFGSEARITKAVSVNGRLVFVVDGAVTEEVRAQLYECLQTDAFKRTEFARPDTREFRHHVVEYNVEKLRRTELFDVANRLVEALFVSGQDRPALQVYRIYTNAIQFGDVGFVHRDSGESEHVTALFYPNPEWAPELGGETVFYDEGGEIVEAVEPRPGRLVLFRGCILHKGSVPTRLLWGSRYTTAFKFAPEEPPEDEDEIPDERPRFGNQQPRLLIPASTAVDSTQEAVEVATLQTPTAAALEASTSSAGDTAAAHG